MHSYQENSKDSGYNFDSETNHHMDNMKGGVNNILVAVRSRPISQKEKAVSDFETLRVLDKKVVVLLDPGNNFEKEDVS